MNKLLSNQIKKRSHDQTSKRQRKRSLKALELLDREEDSFTDTSTWNTLSHSSLKNGVAKEFKENTQQLECQENGNHLNDNSILQNTQAVLWNNWADGEVLVDSELCAYTTPLKIANYQNSCDKILPSVVSTSKKAKCTHNFSNDSWFEEVDLSLLENECLNKLEQQNNGNTDSNQQQLNLKQKNDLTPSTNNGHFHNKLEDRKLFIASTPKSEKSKTNFTSKLRRRLVENGYKTPLSENKLTLNGDKINLNDPITNDPSKATISIDEMSTQDIGPFYGLPTKFKQLLEKLRGIKKLYDWQNECLTRDEIKAGKNLVYTLPTSGGKTLVAEILILKALLCHKKNAVLVLPFVAIVQEKIQSLSQFAVELGFLIEEYAGGKGKFPPRKRRKKNVLYVCTIEKANSLINSLIETERLNELKLVVVDELHMIGDGGRRGATIEIMLAKLLYVSAPVQIVGMSATLSNTDELGGFLNANVFHNDFRPVKLEEFVKVTDCVYRIFPDKLHPDEQMVKERTLSYSSNHGVVDSDHLAGLASEVVPEHSCLIFCPTKKNCENVALMLCKLLPRNLTEHCQKEKADILKALRNENGLICPTLSKVIPYGVAYHHSGLTTDERHIIEEAYRNEVLSIITCTSTLAAGVNLPARRVIIRSPHIGQDFMTRAQYKQMIGRAGRAGIDSKGESYLIVTKHEDRPRIPDLVAGPMETCRSSLLYGNGKGFQALLLSLIVLNIVSTTSQILAFFSRTLCSKQMKTLVDFQPDLFEGVNFSETNSSALSGLVKKSLQALLDLELIEKSTETKDEFSLKPTKLGIATSKCGIDFDMSRQLYQDLKRGLEGLVLDNYLHLLYLVTPYDASCNVTPSWLVYMSEMNRLSDSELAAANFIGVPEQYIVRRASGNHPRKKKINEETVRRFYVTLMLYQLFNGHSVWDVAARFQQPRGFLQSLSISSAAFASGVFRFSQEFEQFWPYQALLEKLIEVLQYSRNSELVPLLEIASVKSARAKQLYRTGYKSLAQVASVNADLLVQDIDHLSRRQAQQIIASAKILLTEKIDNLQEEVESLRSVQ